MKKEAIFPSDMPRPRVAYSPVVKAGPFVFVSGLLASDMVSGTPQEARINPNFPNLGSTIERQTRFVADNLGRCLRAAGASLDNTVFYMAFQTNPADANGCARVMQQVFGKEAPPPSTTIVVEELPVPGCALEVDLVGYIPQSGERLEVLAPKSLPTPAIAGLGSEPLFRYGMKAGPWIFTAGLTATDFNNGVAPAARHDPVFPYYAEVARLQTDYILKNHQTILAEGGASIADVVKAEVFLTDIKDFYRLEQVWKQYFPTDPPARTTVQVKDLGVPGLRVAINLIAFVPQGGQRKRTIRTDDAPHPLAHEPQAVQAGPLLFFSQQMATDFRTGVPPEARLNPAFSCYGSESEAQVNYIVKNIEAICRAAGTSSENLIRRRGFYTDFGEFFTSFATWAKAFPAAPPASTTVRVPGPLLVTGCKVAIDLLALIPGA
ncbi:MAG TPA: RidA family protein [Candidatus Binataceae bacterium]|nr:RidA family protein [Candidatus Binataceae bacterium]